MGNQQSDERRPLGLCVIELVCLNNLPNMDVGSLTDSYALLSFRSGSNIKMRLGGIELKSQPKNNSLNPIFHSFQEFPFLPNDDDSLCIKILDYDVTSKDDKIGKAYIPMRQLKAGVVLAPLTMSTNAKSNAGATTVTVRLTYCGPRQPAELKKEIFLIRHGESKWNISQSQKNLKGMVAQYDHELTQVGLEQAASFNRKWKEAETSTNEEEREDFHVFSSAEAIFASPLTRATQTALLTCENHRVLQQSDKGLVLLSELREVKNFGSFDTVGRFSGEEIKANVQQMITRDLGEERSLQILSPRIDSNDAQEQWWTALETRETKNDVVLRMDDVWRYLKYATDSNVIVLVGHSHYFRNMLQEYLSPEYRANEPEWTTSLDKKKLDNGACLRITAVWRIPANEDLQFFPSPVIEKAKLIFGTQLIGDDGESTKNLN